MPDGEQPRGDPSAEEPHRCWTDRRSVLQTIGVGGAIATSVRLSERAQADAVGQGASTSASATATVTQSDRATLRIYPEIEPTETTDLARVELTWEIDEEIVGFESSYDQTELTLVESQALETTAGTVSWDRDKHRDAPRAVFEYDVTERAGTGVTAGKNAAVTDSWALVWRPSDRTAVSRPESVPPQFIWQPSPAGEGTTGGSLVYQGQYEDYTTAVGGEQLRLVVPAHVSVDGPALLDQVASAAAQIGIGGQSIDQDQQQLSKGTNGSEVTGFVASDPIRTGGLTIGTDFWFHEDTSEIVADNAVLHEYVHTRQEYRPAATLEWTIEGSAVYYGARLAWQDGAVTYDELRSVLADGEAHENVVLADRRTWTADFSGRRRGDYEKGALVLAALDAEIQAATDNGTTLRAVFKRLNEAGDDATTTGTVPQAHAHPDPGRDHTPTATTDTAVQGADDQLTQIGCKLFEPAVEATKQTADRFQTIAEEVADTDLSAFFDAYVRGDQTPPVPGADELLRLSAAFTVQPAAPDVTTTVTFDAGRSTPVPGNSVDQYEWTLGDGTTATGQTVAHSYDDPGEYTVELTITSGDEQGRRSESVVVQPELTAAFSVSAESPTTTDEVRFDASETVPGDSVDRYEWTFGDGTTATGQTVAHSYDDPGEYTVELTVTSGDEQATVTEQLTVQASTDDRSTSDGASDETDETDGTDGTNDPGADDETESDDGAGPGFGIPSVVASVGTVGYLLRRHVTDRATDRSDE